MKSLIILFALFYLASARTGKGLAGGWSSKDTNHESVKDNVKFAVNVLNDRSNGMHFENLVHIHKALSQVVSGVKYNLTVDMGKTVCRKNEVEKDKLEMCILDQASPINRCEITVWERPWLNEKRLLHSQCKPYLSYQDYFSEAHIAEDRAYHRNKEASLM